MSKAKKKEPETNEVIIPPFRPIPKIINGGVAGITGVICVFPLDLVKTRLQNQPIGPNGEKTYSSIFDCFKKTIRADGLFGMYRGSAVNLILVTPEKAIKLAANDYFRYQLTTRDGKLPVTSQMLAGGLAGAFQIIVTTPMELLKINMQDSGRIAAAAKAAGKTVERASAMAIASKLMKEKGLFGLYRGLGPTAWRDITFSIVYFPMFAFLNDLGPKKVDKPSESVFWVSFLSGLASGCACALAVTPFDVIKTRLQASKAEGELVYTGMVDCFSKTLSREGITAFFKGGLCRIMVISPLFGIAQMVYYFGVGEFIVGDK